ncbi:prepilin peptidase [Vibrio astriarenae]|uniref:prepilin peptidase n=1 Tax=Vibrio astriarenae TaxID=1481923 RepID=UPI0037369046
MSIALPIWILLIITATHDAREHRIPNFLLALIISVECFYIFKGDPSFWLFLSALAAGAILFSCGFLIFLAKGMAPGDVKLLFCVGFVTGVGGITQVLIGIGMSCLLMGILYYFAHNPGVLSKRTVLFAPEHAGALIRGVVSQSKGIDTSNSRETKIPFAPIVVIGLAITSYFF